jgi:sec-independent protein translocase protein TatB
MSLGIGEIILILVIAFVVVGPEDLPKVARGLARALKQIRLLFAGVKEDLDIDGELKEIGKDLGEMKRDVNVDSGMSEEIEDIARIRREIMKK